MSLTRLQTIITREFLEIARNRLLLLTIFLPPLLLSLLPVGMLGVLGGEMGRRGMTPDQIARYYSLSPEFSRYSPNELAQVVLLQEFVLLFLLMPLIIPVSIAAYSIIGEKESRSLEPLLATPVRTGELLLGKSIAAVVPAMLTTWLAYVVFITGIHFVAPSPLVLAALLNPKWLLAMVLLAPLLSLFSVSLGVIISSRVNDTRAAQQIGGVIVIPLVLLGVAQATGFILLSYATFVVGALLVALLDAGVLYLGARLFQREAILTRWK